MTGDWILPFLRYAFLAGLLVLMIQSVRAVFTNLTPRPVPSPGTLVLAVEDPARMRGQEFIVSDGAIIGRALDSTICVSEDHVSANHARLFEREGALWVEDLQSANGTLLNGQRLHRAGLLRVGDRLTVGTVVLVLREASSRAEP